MNTYKIVLKKDKEGHKEYITRTQKKYFNYAVDYAIKNNCNNVRVNKINYSFDFDNLEVEISNKKIYIKYKIEEV